jgi:hypothetical protein
VSGLYASLDLTRSYVAVVSSAADRAAVVGDNNDQGAVSATSCFWDSSLLGASALGPGATVAAPSGVQGVSTASLQTHATFAGWDFASVWNPPAGSYPTLR